jgi:hypothetical protein
MLVRPTIHQHIQPGDPLLVIPQREMYHTGIFRGILKVLNRHILLLQGRMDNHLMDNPTNLNLMHNHHTQQLLLFMVNLDTVHHSLNTTNNMEPLLHISPHILEHPQCINHPTLERQRTVQVLTRTAVHLPKPKG